MVIGPSNFGLPERESARFAARCRQHGFRPDHFWVDTFLSTHPDDAFSSMTREISIIHIHYCCRRRYQTDHFADWLAVFEKDLRNGFFHAWYGYEWA